MDRRRKGYPFKVWTPIDRSRGPDLRQRQLYGHNNGSLAIAPSNIANDFSGAADGGLGWHWPAWPVLGSPLHSKSGWIGRSIRAVPRYRSTVTLYDLPVVAATGHWLTPTPTFDARTADELANLFTLEIERGMEETGIKPAVIKAASEWPGPICESYCFPESATSTRRATT
jgi:hypothetical protein